MRDLRCAVSSLLLFALVATTGCDDARRSGAVGVPRASEGQASTDEPDPRAADLAYLLDRAGSIHPRLYGDGSRATIQKAVDDLVARLPTLDRYHFMVEVMRLVARFGDDGGEAHTGLFPFEQSIPLSYIPLRLYLFPEGVFVVDAKGKLDRLIGAELTHIDGVPIERVARRVEPLIARDNKHSLRARVPWLLVQAEILHSVGILEEPSGAALRLRTESRVFEEKVGTIPGEAFQDWAGVWHEMIPAGLPADEEVVTFSRLGRDVWIDRLNDSGLIFIQYNATLSDTAAVARRLNRLARQHPSATVVLDLRHNPGGEVATFAPLLRSLLRDDIRSRLVVLIGRATLSAAAVLISELERNSDPLLVGEPTGAKPSFYGDPVAVGLPGSGLVVEIAGIEWPAATRAGRDAFVPDVRIPLRAKDYFAHRDPVLEWLERRS